jgi:hypothetical protein
MGSSSEIHHAQNVANFEQLALSCTSLGAACNPVNRALSVGSITSASMNHKRKITNGRKPQTTHCKTALKKCPNYPFLPTFLNPQNTVKVPEPTVHHEISTVRSLTKTIPFFCFSLVALLTIFQNKNQKDTTIENAVMMVSKGRTPAGIHPAITQNEFEYRISEGSVDENKAPDQEYIKKNKF